MPRAVHAEWCLTQAKTLGKDRYVMVPSRKTGSLVPRRISSACNCGLNRTAKSLHKLAVRSEEGAA